MSATSPSSEPVSTDSVPRVRAGVDLMAFELSPEEAFLLSRIDGALALSSLIPVTGLNEEVVLRLLRSLVEKGLVVLDDNDAPDTADAEAPHRPEGEATADTGLISTAEQARRF